MSGASDSRFALTVGVLVFLGFCGLAAIVIFFDLGAGRGPADCPDRLHGEEFLDDASGSPVPTVDEFGCL
jgi:hypothetical protein